MEGARWVTELPQDVHMGLPVAQWVVPVFFVCACLTADSSFTGSVFNLKPILMRVYLPPDANYFISLSEGKEPSRLDAWLKATNTGLVVTLYI